MAYHVRFRLAAAAVAIVLVIAAAVALIVVTDDDSAGTASPGRGTADAFRDSIGVNVHLTYTDTAYANFDLVARRLRQAGIRHVRDGLVVGAEDQQRRFRALGRDGIGATLIIGQLGSAPPDQLVALARSAVPTSLDAVEAPNEADARGGDWAQPLRTYMGQLHRAAKTGGRPLTVLGPSFINRDSRGALGDVSSDLDAGNIHSYPGGGPPEANINSELQLARQVSGTKPVESTETGYHTAVDASGDGVQPGVTPQVAADYLPRLYLSYFAAGIRRTFWYELADEGTSRSEAEQQFGLLDADLDPKPAFRALQNLIGLTVADRGAPEEGAGTPIRPRLGVPSSAVRSVVLSRDDGTQLVALWRPIPLQPRGEASPMDVDVDLGRTFDDVAVYRPSRSARATATLRSKRRVTVALRGDVVVLAVRN